jgi:phosphopantetheine adenylyltransferase
VARYGGDVSAFVPKAVNARLMEKFGSAPETAP